VRTGIGYDVHRLVAGRPMWLAGLLFPDEPVGPQGHSDGDVAAHAGVDALLSAAGLGDLGTVFGTTEPRWAGAAGVALLARAAHLVRQAGFQIDYLAIQVVGARPRLGGRRPEAQAALAAAIGAPVAVGASSGDGLGPIGRGEGVAAWATATLRAARPGPPATTRT
jgi:2-C-methyl-D-erythritol 2,4-cyclodiphosphate synthase